MINNPHETVADCNVLIACRDSVAAKSVKSFLEGEGMNVILCHTFDEFSEDNSPAIDLIVMDISESDSAIFREIETAKQILPDASLIVTSDYPDTYRIIAALNAGAEDYLIQPYSNRELLATLLATLHKHRQE